MNPGMAPSACPCTPNISRCVWLHLGGTRVCVWGGRGGKGVRLVGIGRERGHEPINPGPCTPNDIFVYGLGRGRGGGGSAGRWDVHQGQPHEGFYMGAGWGRGRYMGAIRVCNLLRCMGKSSCSPSTLHPQSEVHCCSPTPCTHLRTAHYCPKHLTKLACHQVQDKPIAHIPLKINCAESVVMQAPANSPVLVLTGLVQITHPILGDSIQCGRRGVSVKQIHKVGQCPLRCKGNQQQQGCRVDALGCLTSKTGLWNMQCSSPGWAVEHASVWRHVVGHVACRCPVCAILLAAVHSVHSMECLAWKERQEGPSLAHHASKQ